MSYVSLAYHQAIAVKLLDYLVYHQMSVILISDGYAGMNHD